MEKEIVVWIDEAWRWPWAGPVVAAVFCFNKSFRWKRIFTKQLKDSKKLNSKSREKIYEEILELSQKWNICFWLGIVDNHVIDEINIRNANKLAMEKALEDLFYKIDKNLIKEIIVDWNDKYKFNNNYIPTNFLIWWDNLINEIKAASIIAKVFRDNLMVWYSKIYPNHWFELHKWYWTKKHQDALDKFWPSWIHRKSYAPIKKCLDL